MKKSYLIAATIGLFSLSTSFAQDSAKAKKEWKTAGRPCTVI